MAAVLLALLGAAQADAFTLKLVFADGQPMTFGSACAGAGCLQGVAGPQSTDAHGEVVLDAGPGATIEYRRDAISLAQAPPGVAAGSVPAVGDRATVVLPRMLVPGAPAVDEVESDLVARLNQARAAAGLTLAQINPRLAAAADLHATWLTQAGVAYDEPERFHLGPFATEVGFRLGEASFPEAADGGEIVAAGMTPAQAAAGWMASAAHRDVILAPGRLLVGPARAGGFLVVATHAACANCEEAGPGVRAPAGGPGAAPTATGQTSGSAVLASCGRETLRVRQLRSLRRGVLRLRVRATCLRPGAAYRVVVREGRAGRILARRSVRAAGTFSLKVRPSPSARRLRIRLQRDRRPVRSRSLTLRRR